LKRGYSVKVSRYDFKGLISRLDDAVENVARRKSGGGWIWGCWDKALLTERCARRRSEGGSEDVWKILSVEAGDGGRGRCE
jgi:hypothetical protein